MPNDMTRAALTLYNRNAAQWMRRAACSHRCDLEWIDPKRDQAEQCRALCSTCPVRQQCLHHALVTGEPWGIWGGLDPDERAAIAATDGHPAPTVLPMHGTNARYAKHYCRCQTCRAAHTAYEHSRLARRRSA